ncbi:hypothetical protein COBT_003212 [Conglomerata obtusa]
MQIPIFRYKSIKKNFLKSQDYIPTDYYGKNIGIESVKHGFDPSQFPLQKMQMNNSVVTSTTIHSNEMSIQKQHYTSSNELINLYNLKRNAVSDIKGDNNTNGPEFSREHVKYNPSKVFCYTQDPNDSMVINRSFNPKFGIKRTHAFNNVSYKDSQNMFGSKRSKKNEKLNSYNEKNCNFEAQSIIKNNTSCLENIIKDNKMQHIDFKGNYRVSEEYVKNTENGIKITSTVLDNLSVLSITAAKESATHIAGEIYHNIPIEITVNICQSNCDFCTTKINNAKTTKNDHDPYEIDKTNISEYKYSKYNVQSTNKVFKYFESLQILKNNVRNLQNYDCLLLHHLKVYENTKACFKKVEITKEAGKLSCYNRFYVESIDLHLQNYKFLNTTQINHISKINDSDAQSIDIISLTQFLDIKNCLILAETCKQDNIFFYKLRYFVKNNFLTDKFEFDILYLEILLNVYKIDERVYENLNHDDIKKFIIQILKSSSEETLLYFIELPGLIFYLEKTVNQVIFKDLFKDFGVYLSLLNILAVLLKFDWNQIKTKTEGLVVYKNYFSAYAEVIATQEKYRQIFNIVLLYVLRPFLEPLLYLQAWQKNILRNIYSNYFFNAYKINSNRNSRPKIFFFQLIDLALYVDKELFAYNNTYGAYLDKNYHLPYFVLKNSSKTNLKNFFIADSRRSKLIYIYDVVSQNLRIAIKKETECKLNRFNETLKITVEYLKKIEGTYFVYNVLNVLTTSINDIKNEDGANLKTNFLAESTEIIIKYLCRLYMLFYTNNSNIDIIEMKLLDRKSKKIKNKK